MIELNWSRTIGLHIDCRVMVAAQRQQQPWHITHWMFNVT
jgi:hypothetical protein